MKKIMMILILLLLLCASTSTYGRVVGTESEKLGAFTGPVDGTAQDDNVKASLDLLHDLIGPSMVISTGEIIYCDSGASAGGETGTSWTNAAITLDGAVNLCTEDRGDIILVAAGHTETLAAADAVDVDIAGVTVIGLGVGEQRPVFDVTTNGEIRIDDADFSIENCVFKAHSPDTTHCFDITDNAHGMTIKDCDFIVDTEGTDEFTDAIDIVAGADYLTVQDCEFHQGGGNAATAFTIDSSDFLVIKDCVVTGDYSTACINSETAASFGVTIKDNVLYNGDTHAIGLNTEPCIELFATDTGVIVNNACFCNVATPNLSIVAADMHLSGNTYNETEGVVAATDVACEVGKAYTVTMSTVMTATTDQMFTVAGGPIEIISLFGQCTTAMGGNPGDMTIEIDATDGTNYDNDFSTTVTIDTVGAGDVITFTNAISEGVLTFVANQNAGQTLSWFCPEGEIEQTLTSTGTGAVEWFMTFRPLVVGVSVTEN